MIINTKGVSPRILRAVHAMRYSGEGETKFASVTGLTKGAYQFHLLEQHGADLEIEAEDMMSRLIGQAFHAFAEAANMNPIDEFKRMLGRIKTLGEKVGLVAESAQIIRDMRPLLYDEIKPQWGESGIITERRLSMEIDGHLITGGIDHYEAGLISDYKTISCSSYNERSLNLRLT